MSFNNPVVTKPEGVFNHLSSLGNVVRSNADSLSYLGSFTVSINSGSSHFQDVSGENYARASALQLSLADGADTAIPLPKRRFSSHRRRVSAKFTRSEARTNRESEPEGSLERDNRRQGQGTVQIAKRIIAHMEIEFKKN